jgi:uncharacterized membrane protein YuzA (DUF378 family)
MKIIHIVSFVLLVIGGLNWLLVAFGWNLVSAIFGADTIAAKIIYILVGVAALIEIFTHGKNCRTCNIGAVAK